METSNGLGHVLVLRFLTTHNLCTSDLVSIILRRCKGFCETLTPNSLHSPDPKYPHLQMVRILHKQGQFSHYLATLLFILLALHVIETTYTQYYSSETIDRIGTCRNVYTVFQHFADCSVDQIYTNQASQKHCLDYYCCSILNHTAQVLQAQSAQPFSTSIWHYTAQLLSPVPSTNAQLSTPQPPTPNLFKYDKQHQEHSTVTSSNKNQMDTAMERLVSYKDPCEAGVLSAAETQHKRRGLADLQLHLDTRGICTKNQHYFEYQQWHPPQLSTSTFSTKTKHQTYRDNQKAKTYANDMFIAHRQNLHQEKMQLEEKVCFDLIWAFLFEGQNVQHIGNMTDWTIDERVASAHYWEELSAVKLECHGWEHLKSLIIVPGHKFNGELLVALQDSLPRLDALPPIQHHQLLSGTGRNYPSVQKPALMLQCIVYTPLSLFDQHSKKDGQLGATGSKTAVQRLGTNNKQHPPHQVTVLTSEKTNKNQDTKHVTSTGKSVTSNWTTGSAGTEMVNP